MQPRERAESEGNEGEHRADQRVKELEDSEERLRKELSQLRRSMQQQKRENHEEQENQKQKMMRIGVGVVVALILFELLKYFL